MSPGISNRSPPCDGSRPCDIDQYTPLSGCSKLVVISKNDDTGDTMTEPGKNDHTAHGPTPWSRLWSKVKVPAQLIAGQLIGWALRKWLG